MCVAVTQKGSRCTFADTVQTGTSSISRTLGDKTIDLVYASIANVTYVET